MNKLMMWLRDIATGLRGRARARAMQSEEVAHLVGTVRELRREVAELTSEIDDLRAESRHIAELGLLVEEQLINPTKSK